MINILTVGCSFTQGYGLALTDKDPELWVNQLASQVFGSAKIDNLAEPGRNNHWIFTEAATRARHYDYIIVGWTYLTRLNFDIGLELYNTRTRLDASSQTINVCNGAQFDRTWQIKTGDRLRMIHNDHWAIIDLIKYINILLSLKPGAVFFVNTFLPWNRDYFTYKGWQQPDQLDQYQRDIMLTDKRDDQESKKIYNMIHHQYQNYGGICESSWLNLYDSFESMQIDSVVNGSHPGYKSQTRFADYLVPILKEKVHNENSSNNCQ